MYLPHFPYPEERANTVSLVEKNDEKCLLLLQCVLQPLTLHTASVVSFCRTLLRAMWHFQQQGEFP